MTTFDIDSVPADIARLGVSLPKFDDGRIDYTDASEAAVLDCIIMCKGKILLLKRSDKVGWLKNCWHVIAGFLDEEVSLREKALTEMREEIGVLPAAVRTIYARPPFQKSDGSKLWIIHPVFIELSDFPEITLDWENTEYVWVELDDIGRYSLIDSVLKALYLR